MSKKTTPTSISDIHQKAKEAEVMTKAASHAVAQLQNALERIALLEAENRHLKDLLVRTNEKLVINPTDTKNEELVADFEIKRLKEAAQSRPLSMEEAKIYKIMTDAKKVIREVEEKDNNRAKDVTNSASIQELLQLAQSSVQEAQIVETDESSSN